MNNTNAPRSITEPFIAQSNAGEAGANLTDVLAAIREYYDAVNKCESCAKMLLSDGCDPEPARLMTAMFRARVKMFSLAGIKAHNEQK